ncbi:nuclear receptor-binding factor 2-like protein [Leptotrombidium deliense]|uniref:Nuclear receptor-binding factor 2-like protein n=1 Tax=Leptotrombidium deliense TaxID=299467 RepID=A0A443SG30_9ACAR|nr:nuclear receptor-binding factor 2-like protein [Leptotrombidium deliense]
MDVYIESPLNKAHRFERKAEDFEKCCRFEEAIECHKNAKECLLEAKKCASSLGGKQSIDAQINFHENQEKILANRQAAFQHKIDIYKNKQKEQMIAKEEKRSSMNFGNSLQIENEGKNVAGETEIEKAIYRAIEEHDSLVQFLIHREDQTIEKDAKNLNTSSYKSGNKLSKDDKTVIEELRTNNEQNL